MTKTSDIDGLLFSLREIELWTRRLAASSRHKERELAKADQTARWIAAVEGLVAFKANHVVPTGAGDLRPCGKMTVMDAAGAYVPQATELPEDAIRRYRDGGMSNGNPTES